MTGHHHYRWMTQLTCSKYLIFSFLLLKIRDKGLFKGLIEIINKESYLEWQEIKILKWEGHQDLVTDFILATKASLEIRRRSHSEEGAPENSDQTGWFWGLQNNKCFDRSMEVKLLAVYGNDDNSTDRTDRLGSFNSINILQLLYAPSFRGV